MSYKIISKFIKDVSFEIPNVQSFVMLEKEIANYSLNFDITSKPYKKKYSRSKHDIKNGSQSRC